MKRSKSSRLRRGGTKSWLVMAAGPETLQTIKTTGEILVTLCMRLAFLRTLRVIGFPTSEVYRLLARIAASCSFETHCQSNEIYYL